jgi:hypothetical protein
MVAGLATIVFLKISHRGVGVHGWLDVLFYLLAPPALMMVIDLFFASIYIDDQQMKIVGLFFRRNYALDDIADVSTEKGASVKFRLKDGRWITLPSWAPGWGVAAALRARLKRTAET